MNTPRDLRDFEGLVACVTGGASGIGLASATELAQRGAQVALLDVASPGDAPAGTHHVYCDVTDDRSVRAAIETTARRHGRLDIVIANAGIGAQGTVEESSDEEWHRVLDLNFVGVARTVRAAVPHLRRSPAGAVVVTCSIASWAGCRAAPCTAPARVRSTR